MPGATPCRHSWHHGVIPHHVVRIPFLSTALLSSLCMVKPWVHLWFGSELSDQCLLSPERLTYLLPGGATTSSCFSEVWAFSTSLVPIVLAKIRLKVVVLPGHSLSPQRNHRHVRSHWNSFVQPNEMASNCPGFCSFYLHVIHLWEEPLIGDLKKPSASKMGQWRGRWWRGPCRASASVQLQLHGLQPSVSWWAWACHSSP